MQVPEKIQEYAQEVGRQVRWKKIKPALEREIEEHACDQYLAYCEKGMDKDAAAEKAVAEMGDAVEVGRQLDRVHRPKMQAGMLLLAAMMLLSGMLLSVSASGGTDILHYALIYLAAFGIMIFCCYLDFTVLGKHARAVSLGIAAGAAGVFLLPHMQIMGRKALHLGPWNISFALLASVFPLCYALFVYSMRNKGTKGILMCGAFYLPLVVMLLSVPVVSGAVLFTMAALAILCTAVCRGWFGAEKKKGLCLVLLPAAVICVGTGALLLTARPAIWNRILHKEPSYLNELLNRAASGSAILGQGMGMTSEEIRCLAQNAPLSFAMNTFGKAAVILIVLMCALFSAVGLIKALREKSMLGTLVALSVILMFAMQSALCVAENLALTDFYGNSIPFIGHDTQLLFVSSALTGFMLSVFRSGEVLKQSESRPVF